MSVSFSFCLDLEALKALVVRVYTLLPLLEDIHRNSIVPYGPVGASEVLGTYSVRV